MVNASADHQRESGTHFRQRLPQVPPIHTERLADQFKPYSRPVELPGGEQVFLGQCPPRPATTGHTPPCQVRHHGVAVNPPRCCERRDLLAAEPARHQLIDLRRTQAPRRLTSASQRVRRFFTEWVQVRLDRTVQASVQEGDHPHGGRRGANLYRLLPLGASSRGVARADREPVAEDHDPAATLHAARRGDEWAIASLFERHQPALLRYLSARVRQAAEDVASQVWLEAVRALERFDGDDTDFRKLLFVIARRRLANERRRLARARTVSLTAEMATGLAGGAGADPLEQLAGDDAARLILALLPERQAEVVLLRVVAGFSAEETAELLDLRANTVRVLQHRALRTLARKLAPSVTDHDVAGIEGLR